MEMIDDNEQTVQRLNETKDKIQTKKVDIFNVITKSFIDNESTRCDQAKGNIAETDNEDHLETFNSFIGKVDNMSDQAIDNISEKDSNDPLEAMMEQIDGVWKCKVCGRTRNQKSHIKDHVETHIEGAVHLCKTCGKIYR